MSAARVPLVPSFHVVVAVDEAVALAPVRAMRRTVLLSTGVALGVLLGLGALFTRRLNRRLAHVVAGAEAFGRGELDKRVTVEGDDELTELASTFNRMGAELEASRARLLRWNDDLKRAGGRGHRRAEGRPGPAARGPEARGGGAARRRRGA